jgi:hypothetical protein
MSESLWTRSLLDVAVEHKCQLVEKRIGCQASSLDRVLYAAQILGMNESDAVVLAEYVVESLLP